MEKEKIISVMKRYELKYLLNSEQLQYFMDQISHYMKVDKYGLTTIASIYFDTPDFRLINKSDEIRIKNSNLEISLLPYVESNKSL